MENNTNALTIEKDKVLAAVVRAFFKYFTLGLIEVNVEDSTDMSVYEPKSVKQIIIPHIEDVSRVFNQEVFYAISRMNYQEEELESELKAFVAAGNKTTPHELMRFACRTTDCYDFMVDEYKRNFESLLCGSFASLSAHVANSRVSVSLGQMLLNDAESIINRIANQAYQEGKAIKA